MTGRGEAAQSFDHLALANQLFETVRSDPAGERGVRTAPCLRVGLDLGALPRTRARSAESVMLRSTGEEVDLVAHRPTIRLAYS